MMFAAELAAISWVSASMLATSRCWHASDVDTGSVPHDLVMLAEYDEEAVQGGHSAKVDECCHARSRHHYHSRFM